MPNVPVLLVYDSTLTFADEVELIWRRKPSVASTIFVINRITTLLIVAQIILIEVDDVRSVLYVAHDYLTSLPGVSPLETLAHCGSWCGSQLSPNRGLACGPGACTTHRSGG